MYGVVTTVPAPVEIYDRMHAELIKRASSFVGDLGLLVHVGRATADGFQLFQVYESKEHYDRAMEISGSLMRDLAGDLPQPSTAVDGSLRGARHRHTARRHRDLAAIEPATPDRSNR